MSTRAFTCWSLSKATWNHSPWYTWSVVLNQHNLTIRNNTFGEKHLQVSLDSLTIFFPTYSQLATVPLLAFLYLVTELGQCMTIHHTSTSEDIKLQSYQWIGVLSGFLPCWFSHWVPHAHSDQLKASTHHRTYTKRRAALASYLPPKSLWVLNSQTMQGQKHSTHDAELGHEEFLGSESSSTTHLSLNLKMRMSPFKSIKSHYVQHLTVTDIRTLIYKGIQKPESHWFHWEVSC